MAKLPVNLKQTTYLDVIVDGNLAGIIGLDLAVLVSYFINMVNCNVAQMPLDGYEPRQEGWWWYRATREKIGKHLIWWTKSKIDVLIHKLQATGILVIKKFNEHPIDATQWFRIDQKILEKYLYGDV